MTAATASRSARPSRPRRSIVGPLGLLVFLGITWWAASEEWGLGVDIPLLLTNLTRGADILAEFWPPDFSVVPRTIGPLLETIQIAVIASLIGCTLALPIAFLASRVTSPNLVVYLIDRGILSVIRALPDVLYALIFVAALSIGPLPGILALVLFNIAVVAKLLSETVDGVDPGPIEAARASGANRLLTVRWAVLPQVLPNYVAYSLYAFELNIRASAVLGIVGAGGIGMVLDTALNLFQWDRVATVLISIFAIVVIAEVVVTRIRKRVL